MASHVKLGRFETCSGMAIRTAGVLAVELSAVRVLVTPLTRLRMSRVAKRRRIEITLLIREVGGVAFLAGHGGVSFIERKTGGGVGLRLNAPGAFRPRLVRRHMAGGASAGPGRAMRRLVTVGAGLPLDRIKGHPQIVDVRHQGWATVVARG